MFFTCALLENNQTQCYLIVRDTRDKYMLSGASFVLKPLEIKFQTSKPKSILWTDGPSSEFENKFVTFFFLLSKTIVFFRF